MHFALKLLLLHLTIVAADFEIYVSEAEVVEVEPAPPAPPPPPPKPRTTNSVEMGSCLFPLIRISNGSTLCRYTSANHAELTVVASKTGMTYEGVLGRVVVDNKRCVCGDGTQLIPAYLMYDKVTDYMLVTDPKVMDNMKAKGFLQMQLDFYCSPQLNKCGATKTLYEHISSPPYKPTHFYTTNPEKSKYLSSQKYPKTGQPCYIWDNGNQAIVD